MRKWNVGLALKNNDWDLIEAAGTIIGFNEDGGFLDGFSTGPLYRGPYIGESRTNHVLTNDVVMIIRESLRRGVPISELCQLYGVNKATAYAAGVGLTWTHIPGQRYSPISNIMVRSLKTLLIGNAQRLIEIPTGRKATRLRALPDGPQVKRIGPGPAFSITPEQRYCSECRLLKDISAFSPNGVSVIGQLRRSHTCKQCRSKIMTARYHQLAREGKLESRKSTRRGIGCTTRPMATGKHASQCYCDVCAVATDPKKRKPPNFRGFYDSEVKLLERIIT